MKRAAVSELKARLSRYLAAVKIGEEVLVTERGKPVAKLIPVPASGEEDHERLREMVRQGLLRPPSKRLPKTFWAQPRPEDPQARVLEALLDERRQGR
jgi:prevent-host-death family protein